MPTTLLEPEVAERTWWKEHPEPDYTPRPIVAGADRLVLWNYPVGKSDLADVHANALRFFLQNLTLGVGTTAKLRSVVSIVGHASVTAEASINDKVARDRAEAVAAYLRTLGFTDENLEVDSLGSSHPSFPALTGSALARNRRVEVTQYNPPIEPTPSEPVDPSKPTGEAPEKVPKPAGGGTYYVEGQFEFELPEVEDATLSAKFAFVVKFKGKVSGGKDPQAAAGLVFSGGKVGAEFKAKVKEKLDVKLGLEPGKTGHPPVLKASVEGEVWGFPVEIGFETERHFLVMEIALPTSPLPEIEINGSTVECEVELTVKVAMGPSKLLLERLAAEAAAGGAVTTGIVAGGVLTVTAVIIGGTIYAGERAKQQMADLVVETAVRDGAASQVACEVLGATDKDVLAMRDQHQRDLHNVGGERSSKGFDDGEKKVLDYLKTFKDNGDATIKAWAETYGKNKNAQDFDKLREQLLYEHFDAYKNDRRPIEQALAEL